MPVFLKTIVTYVVAALGEWLLRIIAKQKTQRKTDAAIDAAAEAAKKEMEELKDESDPEKNAAAARDILGG